MLLIPKAVHEILERGRREGRAEGQREGRHEILETLVKNRDITEERRKELEAERKAD